MLLTAGCSFVWGDELEGFDNNPPTHWEHTFTHILAEKMGINYVNLGMCGAGNEQIFRRVTDYLHKNPDQHVTHMVVLWSAWQRKEWVEYQPPERKVKIARELDVTQFSSLRTRNIYDPLVRESFHQWFISGYNTRTDIMQTLSKMKCLELLCESKGIRLIQGVFHKRNYSNIMAILTDAPVADGKPVPSELEIDKVPEYKEWLLYSIGSLKPSSRLGMGGKAKIEDLYSIGLEKNDIKEFGHPGELSNKIYADILFETFGKIESGAL